MSDDAPSHAGSRWFGPFIVAVAAIIMLIWTWGTWPDVLVDFGVQLYVPWRLINGEVLYRDIAHYTGPLSIYYNAFAFKLTGPSLRTLVVANLPILAGIIALVYYLTLRLGGTLCATVAGVSFVILFAFAHLTAVGNYNYVCPYEYEYTHAMLFCLAGIGFLWRFLKTKNILWAALAGLMAGLVFLTRAEFFVAIAGAGALTFLLALRGRRSLQVLLLSCLAYTAAMVIPAITSIFLLSRAMPLHVALAGTLGMWPAVLKGAVAQQVFYHHSMGTDHPIQSLMLLGFWSGIYLAIAGGFVLWSRRARGDAKAHAMTAAVVSIAIAAAVWFWLPGDNWISLFRPLPAVALVLLGIALYRCRASAAAPSCERAAVFAVFSLLLLAKIILYARIIQYGWTLAMPATMLLIVCAFAWIPHWLQQRTISSQPYLGGLFGAWAVVLLIHLNFTRGQIGRLQTSVGQGGDAFWADRERGGYVNHAIDLAYRLPADKTIDCFPEGIMINYLAQRRVSTPYVNFNPPDLLLFGEENMLRSLEASPPDFVMRVHKDTSEFGYRSFGIDYGQSIGRWIERNYEPMELPAGIDLGTPPAGIQALQRKSAK